MKRLIIVLFISLGACLASLGAQEQFEAKVLEVAGKVEFKSGSGSWRPMKVGMNLAKGTMISTGFKSSAIIQLGDATITVRPVTRLSLEELIKSEKGTQTELFLTAGRVKAEVTPSKVEKVEFSIRSATATASVRGTGFETDGRNLIVTHGMVELKNIWGQFRYVGGGEYSRVEPDSSVSIPLAVNPETGLERLDEVQEQVDAENASNAMPDSIGALETTVDLNLVFE